MPDPAPPPVTPATQLLARLEDAGFYHKDLADLIHTDRTLVTHWRNGTRQLPVDQLARLGAELTRRWPERRLLWAELLLGGLAAALGCRLIPDAAQPDAAPQRVVHLDPERHRRVIEARDLLDKIVREAA